MLLEKINFMLEKYNNQLQKAEEAYKISKLIGHDIEIANIKNFIYDLEEIKKIVK